MARYVEVTWTETLEQTATFKVAEEFDVDDHDAVLDLVLEVTGTIIPSCDVLERTIDAITELEG
jgi:hypothetical protein